MDGSDDADRSRSSVTFSRPHLAFVVNTDWFFLSHRLPIAKAAIDSDMVVTLIAPDTGEANKIRDCGIQFVDLPIRRAGMNPIDEAMTVAFLRKTYKQLAPDLIHHVTPKPVIYGSLVARSLHHPAVVNAISGLGHVFSAERSSVARWLTTNLYRQALASPRWRSIFQNVDDLELFVRLGLVERTNTVLIRGSGVNVDRFVVRPEPTGTPVVVLASRLLQDKGVAEFVAAARLLRNEGVAARFVLVGRLDPDNPAAVTELELQQWIEEGAIEWWGHRQDMPEVLAKASVVALPSHYREGLPKILVEAAACGRPMVATDMPGCREIVRPGVTGQLVPPHAPMALARAIGGLLEAPARRAEMGRRARALVEGEFSEAEVVRRTLALYDHMLAAAR